MIITAGYDTPRHRSGPVVLHRYRAGARAQGGDRQQRCRGGLWQWAGHQSRGRRPGGLDRGTEGGRAWPVAPGTDLRCHRQQHRRRRFTGRIVAVGVGTMTGQADQRGGLQADREGERERQRPGGLDRRGGGRAAAAASPRSSRPGPARHASAAVPGRCRARWPRGRRGVPNSTAAARSPSASATPGRGRQQHHPGDPAGAREQRLRLGDVAAAPRPARRPASTPSPRSAAWRPAARPTRPGGTARSPRAA